MANKYSVTKFSAQGKISKPTIYDWVKRGFLEAKKWGGRDYFTSADLLLIPKIRKLLRQNQHRIIGR